MRQSRGTGQVYYQSPELYAASAHCRPWYTWPPVVSAELPPFCVVCGFAHWPSGPCRQRYVKPLSTMWYSSP